MQGTAKPLSEPVDHGTACESEQSDAKSISSSELPQTTHDGTVSLMSSSLISLRTKQQKLMKTIRRSKSSNSLQDNTPGQRTSAHVRKESAGSGTALDSICDGMKQNASSHSRSSSTMPACGTTKDEVAEQKQALDVKC